MAIALSAAACGQVAPGALNGKAMANQVATPQGTAMLSWTPVTENSDGTALTDLGGYKIRYGTSQDAMNTTVVLSDPSLTTYVVTDLSSGTWYFAVAAYTNSGTDGVLSNVASKTIN